MRKIFRDFINGLVFGATHIIPGISGGTIAVVMGFYFELIDLINHFFRDLRKSLKFAIPLLIGFATGLIILSSIILSLLTKYSFPTFLFFIGLIAGIVPHVYMRVVECGQRLKRSNIMLSIIPFVALSCISLLKADNDEIFSAVDIYEKINLTYMIYIFTAGVISAAAMIVPGFSGSFVLLLMGIYNIAIYSISSIGHLAADFSNYSLMLNICMVLVPLGLGILAGIIFMAKLLKKLLIKYQRLVYSVILGLLLGSIFALFIEPMVYRSGFSTLMVIAGIITFILGTLASYFMGKKTFTH